MKSALPIPVPIVSRSTVPGTPFAAPKVTSARPAASASLTRRTGPPEPGREHRLGRRIDPRRVDVRRGHEPARLHDAGQAAPAGMSGVTWPSATSWSTIWPIDLDDRLRRRRLRRLHAEPGRDELAGCRGRRRRPSRRSRRRRCRSRDGAAPTGRPRPTGRPGRAPRPRPAKRVRVSSRRRARARPARAPAAARAPPAARGLRRASASSWHGGYRGDPRAIGRAGYFSSSRSRRRDVIARPRKPIPSR